MSRLGADNRGSSHPCHSCRVLAAHAWLPRRPRILQLQLRKQHVVRAVDTNELYHMFPFLETMLHHMPLAYERVALPCSTMNCGDAIYRSTLDPALRMEQKGLDPRGLALIGAVALYITATPGPLQGFIDTYMASQIQAAKTRVYTKSDLTLGKRVAAGGFGTVYRAELRDAGTVRNVIVKKAKEFGEAEVWMNERLSRAAPQACAKFITAFGTSNTTASRRFDAGEEVWLLWQYEGDNTVGDLMLARAFPYNLEPFLLGRELRVPEGPERKLVTVRMVMEQLLTALKQMHACGIVHRDVKPQNCIVSARDRRVKFIDLGAAADLRVGINYVPNEYLLDPRYAPPQQYIMSTQTPRAPPAPVAALLSPVLWRLNNPDRFDMYSAGIVLMQMAFPGLRSDSNLLAFNRRLEQCDYDLNRWRQQVSSGRSIPKDLQEGFALLDLEDGAGWDLACKLVRYEPRERLSASAALSHAWFGASPFAKLTAAIGQAAGSVPAIEAWLDQSLYRTRDSGLTELELSEKFGNGAERRVPDPKASNTIAWWKQRQESLDRKLKERNKSEVSARR